MHILDNGVQSSDNKTAFFALSGYGACTIGESMKVIFDSCSANNISAFTITKPGHDERKEDSAFTITQLQEEVVFALYKIRAKGFSRIIMIGNSITSFPVIHAANVHEEVIKKLVLIAPVFDLAQTIRKKVKVLAGMDLPVSMGKNGVKQSHIPPQIIPHIAQGVSLAEVSFLQDIQKFGGIHKDDIVAMFPEGVPTDIYANPQDKIIGPRLVQEVAKGVGANVIETTPVEGDITQHNVYFSEIIERIISQIQPETHQREVAVA